MEPLLQFALGQSLPMAIDYINRNVKSSRVRFWIALCICLVMGILASIGDIMILIKDPSLPELGKVFQAGILIFTSSQIAYKQWYENSVIQAKIRNPLY